jgi:hypothetical protein
MSNQPKKMNVIQLTFIVTVNMMGSGIIMLPTNMAKVGAISLLSWLVTAIGSLAIAYGFAEAGLLNQRAGGMAAYAEDGYGRDGYFQVFFLYFLSIAIANVAVASSALGYLAAFFPVLTSSPIATCVGVIGLLWLTTLANFGGPKITGRIGSVTVWGVILPVGFISIAGWFWFHGATFAAAWNPRGLSLGEGMGSSISLTLWAFLGMESAVQNSSAVENPKRDVPLAGMLGRGGDLYPVHRGDPGHRARCGSRSIDRPVRAGLCAHVQPDGRVDCDGAGCDGVCWITARLAVHTGPDGQGCRRHQNVPGHFQQGERDGGADRGHDHHGHHAIAHGAFDDLAKPQ